MTTVSLDYFALPFAELETLEISGDSSAQFELGCRHFAGRDIPKDHAKALGYFQKAADQYHIGALNILGFCYANGVFVERDIAKAIDFYDVAAARGCVEARGSLLILQLRSMHLDKPLQPGQKNPFEPPFEPFEVASLNPPLRPDEEEALERLWEPGFF